MEVGSRVTLTGPGPGSGSGSGQNPACHMVSSWQVMVFSPEENPPVGFTDLQLKFVAEAETSG